MTVAPHAAGIVGASIGMPDIHSGYGFAIGNVAAFDMDADGVVSPGGVGFDINCEWVGWCMANGCAAMPWHASPCHVPPCSWRSALCFTTQCVLHAPAPRLPVLCRRRRASAAHKPARVGH